jgi:hypothetical protein
MTRLAPGTVLSAIVSTLVLLCPVSYAWAGEIFLESDEYEDGEEIVDVFLTAREYAVMVEDIERNGETFDWGWVRTPGGPEPGVAQRADEQPKRGLRKLLPRSSRRRGFVDEPKELGFDLRQARTIAIAPLWNYAGLLDEAELQALREPFVRLGRQLGLEVVDDPANADLALGIALVDISRDARTVPFPVAIRVEPSVTLEVRLIDLRRQTDLILLRNRSHAADVEAAALRYASNLLTFLR